jgi:hypothetical protein
VAGWLEGWAGLSQGGLAAARLSQSYNTLCVASREGASYLGRSSSEQNRENWSEIGLAWSMVGGGVWLQHGWGCTAAQTRLAWLLPACLDIYQQAQTMVLQQSLVAAAVWHSMCSHFESWLCLSAQWQLSSLRATVCTCGARQWVGWDLQT